MKNLNDEEEEESYADFFDRHNRAFEEAFASAKKDYRKHEDIYEATRRRMNAIKALDRPQEKESAD